MRAGGRLAQSTSRLNLGQNGGLCFLPHSTDCCILVMGSREGLGCTLLIRGLFYSIFKNTLADERSYGTFFRIACTVDAESIDWSYKEAMIKQCKS